jgi:hypothetical protein
MRKSIVRIDIYLGWVIYHEILFNRTDELEIKIIELKIRSRYSSFNIQGILFHSLYTRSIHIKSKCTLKRILLTHRATSSFSIVICSVHHHHTMD